MTKATCPAESTSQYVVERFTDTVGSVRRKIGFFGGLLLASFLLAGCSTIPATFTIDGTWQFDSTEPNPIFAGPCKYPSGPITVSDDAGKVLGTAQVTTTDFGLVGGNAVCNVQFKIKGVPRSVHAFMFSVPGYDDPNSYTREELEDIEIDSP